MNKSKLLYKENFIDKNNSNSYHPLSMILSLSNLHKSFMTGFANNIKKDILLWVNLELQQGEIYWFLGVNGAWKTTTLNTIMGFHSIDQGQIGFFWNQRISNSIRKRIWYAPDKTAYFEHLTGRENVMLIGAYAEIEKNERESIWLELFEELGLLYAKDNYVHQYSQGMKQRLGLILSLINSPELIIRDEPMSGLDPLWRMIVKQLMKKLQSEQKTILFSTHILSDVQEIADRFWILEKGQILYEKNIDKRSENLEEIFYTVVNDGRNLKGMRIQ